MLFRPLKNGLYSHNTKNREIALVNCVEENKTRFTNRELEKAKQARELYAMVGFPSEKDFKGLIRNQMLYNVDISTQDIDNAREIFGPDVAALKGKTTRKKTEHVVTDYLAVPKAIFERYKF